MLSDAPVRAAALAALLFGNGAAPPAAGAAELSEETRSLAGLDLEELMQVEVEIVAGRPQQRVSTAAALAVITAEDIRRSGHRTVIEALRMVPGMYVGQSDSNSWLAGARGLTGSTLTANRYLVRVDGRTVHDPLFSGTFWDTVDVLMPDIERIEVIRGPGPTLWGVNAMNGVINIITKDAHATHGLLLQAASGNHLHGHGAVRVGGALGEESSYRVWGKYNSFGDMHDVDGRPMHDVWSSVRLGFRVDGRLDQRTGYTFQGGAYAHPTSMVATRLPIPGRHQEFDELPREEDIGGANLLLRISREDDPLRGWSMQTYLDHVKRTTSGFGVERETLDFEYRRWQHWGQSQQLIWGGQLVWYDDRFRDGPVLSLQPDARSWSTLNVFAQNTSELVPGRLFAMLGSKLTWHDFVGFQVQPSVRVWWTPSDRQTFWAAFSRPVRVPSRLERDGLLVLSHADTGLLSGAAASGIVLPQGIAGNPDLRAETLRAWELGHRLQWGERWALDTTAFYNDYTRLIGVPQTIVGEFTDLGTAEILGVDVALSARLNSRWRMEASYSTLETRVSGPLLPFEETANPEHLAQLRSYLDLGENVEFNAAAYYVDALPFHGVEDHTRLDLGLSWSPQPGLRLSAWGQNLLESSHQEGSRGMVPRTFYLQATLHFGR